MDPNKKVKEIMTDKMVTVGLNDSITMVRSIFEEHDFHHIPVTGRGNKLKGIISKTDMNNAERWQLVFDVTANGQNHLLKAKDIMTSSPIHLDPEDTIGLAADVFLGNKFHALPITEDEELVGIVTTHDLLEYSYKSVLSS